MPQSAIDLWIDRLSRVWLLLRPLPHNRLALVTIGIGGAILLTPFWQPVAVAVAERLGLSVGGFPPYWVGVALVALGLGYHLLAAWLSRPPIKLANAHDLAVVDNLRSNFPISHVVDLANYCEDTHRYENEAYRRADAVVRFLANKDNEFVEPEVRQAALMFCAAAAQFQSFLAYNFFVFPERQSGENLRFAMYPELTWDTGHPTPEQEQIYRKKSDELNTIVGGVQSTSDTLRRALNEKILAFRAH